MLRHAVLGVLRVAKEIPLAGSRMKNTIKTIIVMMCACCVVCSGALALDMSGVIAYPVPYNPDRGPLTIKVPEGDSIKIQIYDINGDSVYNRAGANNTDNLWSGRNNSGKRIKHGLYIIKVTAEDNLGSYGKKLIRILVDYR